MMKLIEKKLKRVEYGFMSQSNPESKIKESEGAAGADCLSTRTMLASSWFRMQIDAQWLLIDRYSR